MHLPVGFWGHPSSSIDWCEDNYAWSYYIAEWWNTWSNVPPIILGLTGLWLAKKNHAKQPRQVALAYFVPILVFIGSFIFHATLTYFGQLLDELPMIYGSLYFHYMHSHHWKYAKHLCVGMAIFITVAMIAFRESPLPLQLSYGALSVLLVARSFYLSTQHSAVRDTRLLELGAFFYGVAFLCWLGDQHFCSSVKHLYLHAMWHLLSGLGGFVWIQFACAHELVSTKRPISIGMLGYTLPFCKSEVTPLNKD